jgi:hypothetical protein
MLRAAQATGIAVLVAVLLGFGAQSQEAPPQTPQVQTDQQPDGAAKSQPQSDQQTGPADQVPIIEQPNAAGNAERQANSDAEKRAEDAREYWPFHIFGARLKITDSLLALFTFLLIIVGGIQGVFLYRTDQGTHKAADAAKLNAEAVMAAEGAHLFPIIKNDNLKEVTKQARWYGDKVPDTDRLATPSVDYCLKNYGKTPAILCSVMHGIDFFDTPSKLRTMHVADELPLEIIAGEKESIEFTIELSAVLSMAMAKAILEYRSQLLFFGQATFRDFFDRQFLCIWEFDGRGGGFSLIKHEERPDPDKKN